MEIRNLEKAVLRIGPLKVLLSDASDIADYVAQDLFLWIKSRQTNFRRDAGQGGGVGVDLGEFLPVQML